jgi:hypothetical protein
MKGRELLSRWEPTGWLPVLLATGLLMLGLGLPGSKPAQRAQAADIHPGVDSAPQSAEASTVCTILDFTVYEDSVIIECSSVSGFSDPTRYGMSADASHALDTNRFLVVVNTAYSLGNDIRIYYSTDTSQNPPRCLASNCGRVIGLRAG